MDVQLISSWFPSLALFSQKPASGGIEGGSCMKLRVVCFPASGCDESMYSSEGTGERRNKSALIVCDHDLTIGS